MALNDALDWLDPQVGETTGYVSTQDVKNALTQIYSDMVVTEGGAPAVSSVNSKTGIVVLTANDVNAEAKGTTSTAINNHLADPDPHVQYLTQTEAGALYDTKNSASTAIATHVAAADPHAQYLEVGDVLPGTNITLNKSGNQITINSTATGSGTGGHTIQDEGTSLSARTKLNFVGTGVTAADDSANDATTVTISAGTGDVTNWRSITAFGAVAGQDCYTAITNAIASAGVGGTVYFPSHASGSPWYTSQSITPLDQQTFVGAAPAPDYDWDHQLPYKRCILRATDSFTGGSLINRNNVNGVTIKNIALVGNGETGLLLGVDLGPYSGGNGERGWTFEHVHFNGFHTALAGHMWVVSVRGCHFSRNGYAIRPSSGADPTSCVFDSFFTDSYIYFNYHHGIAFDSTHEAALTTFNNLRVERNGQSVSTPGTANRDPNACGIYITNSHVLTFDNIQTDANASYGVFLDGSGAGRVHANKFTNCTWKRDGSGNFSTTSIPGVYIRGTDICSFVNNTVTWGDQADSGGTGYTVPKYGVEFAGENNQPVWIGAVEVPASGSTNAYRYTGSNNWQTIVFDTRRSRIDIPAIGDSSAPGTPVIGTTYFSTTQGALRTYNGTGWVLAGGTGSGAVTSVNGSTGAVVLDYSDVGADPSGQAATLFGDAQEYADSVGITMLNQANDYTNTQIAALQPSGQILLLGSSDPIPDGTPVDTIVVRT